MQTETPIARMEAFLRDLQDRLCGALEAADGHARFVEDPWQRAEGGGGRSRVLKHGALFEQAGVGFSLVHGERMPQGSGISEGGSPEGDRVHLISDHAGRI